MKARTEQLAMLSSSQGYKISHRLEEVHHNTAPSIRKPGTPLSDLIYHVILFSFASLKAQQDLKASTPLPGN